MQDFPLLLSTLDLLPDHVGMFRTAWETWDPDPLAAGVNIAILYDAESHSSCHD